MMASQSQQPYLFNGSQFLGSQSQGTPGNNRGQMMASQSSQCVSSQSQDTPDKVMASQSSKLNVSQPQQRTPCQREVIAQWNTPGQWQGMSSQSSQTQGTPDQVMASQSTQWNCSQPQGTPFQGQVMAPQSSQPQGTPFQGVMAPQSSQLPATPFQGQVMASHPSQPQATPGQVQQPSWQMQPPSVIRCQLMPPSHMSRPHHTQGTPVFATPSLSQYLQSQNQNATQSHSTPEEEEQEASRMEKNYKTMTEAGCIQLLTSSIDAILKGTCNNAFRQEIFQLLEAETSDDVAQIFKDKLTALCAKE